MKLFAWLGRQAPPSPSYTARIQICICALACLTIGAAAAAESDKPAAAQQKFDVLELRVLGNTTLDARAIEAAVYPYTGPDKAMADIEAARAALERTYHDRGFGTVFVDIPEQT